MFGNRCRGYAGCGNPVNWSCPCTCDEIDAKEDSLTVPARKTEELPAMNRQMSEIDLDPLFHGDAVSSSTRIKVVDIVEDESALPENIPSKTDVTMEALERYLCHDDNCNANDLDPLDHTECICGLRKLYNPWNRKA